MIQKPKPLVAIPEGYEHIFTPSSFVEQPVLEQQRSGSITPSAFTKFKPTTQKMENLTDQLKSGLYHLK